MLVIFCRSLHKFERILKKKNRKITFFCLRKQKTLICSIRPRLFFQNTIFRLFLCLCSICDYITSKSKEQYAVYVICLQELNSHPNKITTHAKKVLCALTQFLISIVLRQFKIKTKWYELKKSNVKSVQASCAHIWKLKKDVDRVFPFMKAPVAVEIIQHYKQLLIIHHFSNSRPFTYTIG